MISIKISIKIATIRRGCSKYKPGDYCSAMEGDALMKYRDCYHYCLENGCNKDMQVAQGFAPGKSENVVQECYTCSYLEHDNGEVEGNELCPESFKDGEYDDLKLSLIFTLQHRKCTIKVLYQILI